MILDCLQVIAASLRKRLSLKDSVNDRKGQKRELTPESIKLSRHLIVTESASPLPALK
jgi:hypothetical protein